MRTFNELPDPESGSPRKFHLGEGDAAAGLSNIAALLAQCMWESGGEAPFSGCDENNYLSRPSAPCGQRKDGELYSSLNDKPWACEVDPQMTMTAETWASWTPGPMSCAPNTVTEGCCWWGRGAIQARRMQLPW